MDTSHARTKSKHNMKKILLFVIWLIVITSCKGKSCDYGNAICTIFIREWNDSVPKKGRVYMYEKDWGANM